MAEEALLQALRALGDPPDLAIALDAVWWAEAQALPGQEVIEIHAGGVVHPFMFVEAGSCRCLIWPAAESGAACGAVVVRSRAAAAWGVRRLIVTARGRWVRQGEAAPDLVRVTDHINCTGTNPLIGHSTSDGPVFLDIAKSYRENLPDVQGTLDTVQGIILGDGVYLAVPARGGGGAVETAGRFMADVVGAGLISDVFGAAVAGVPWVAYAALEAYDGGSDDRVISVHDFLAICKLLHS